MRNALLYLGRAYTRHFAATRPPSQPINSLAVCQEEVHARSSSGEILENIRRIVKPAG